MKISSAAVQAAFVRLYKHYGPQLWWPADDPFEVMVGAVLTQHTAWQNVAKSLSNLKMRNALSLHGITAMRDEALTTCLRSAGTYNVKVRRLRALCEWLQARGGVHSLRRSDTADLRAELLSVHGIGPETADAILLYALNRPVFVIDAYTQRLTQRLGWADGTESYDQLSEGFAGALSRDTQVFNEYHALIVNHGKQHCRIRPVCTGCCLSQSCKYPTRAGAAQ